MFMLILLLAPSFPQSQQIFSEGWGQSKTSWCMSLGICWAKATVGIHMYSYISYTYIYIQLKRTSYILNLY